MYANTLNNLCTACVSPCLTCTSDLDCLTCIQGRYLLGKECLVSCPANIMVANDVSRTCVSCDTNCLTCETFSYQCTSCNNTIGLYLDGTSCVTECSQNRFLKDDICSPC